MDVRFLEKKGTISFLLFLCGKEPQRFRELKQIIGREATLSQRIKDLEELKLIESVPVKDGRRMFPGYCLTKLGKEITEVLNEMEKKHKKYLG